MRELVGKTEILGGNPSQCHFVHNKSHITSDLGLNTDRRIEKPAANHLSYSTAYFNIEVKVKLSL
jgi:hypothetical protein